MLSCKTYNSLTTEEKSQFFEYLKSIANTKSLAYNNMWDDNWVENSSTLPYVLEKTDRFNSVNGEFYIVYDGNNVVACGGVYRSSFHDDIVIAGVRTWTDEKYRHVSVIRDDLLPIHKAWAIENNAKIVLLTFNEYNKNLIQVFKRRRLGESKERIKTREPKHVFFNGLNEIEFPVEIQYTKQWAIYELLDNQFTFDWNTIKWQGE